MSDKKDGGPAFPVNRAHFAQDGKMLSVDWLAGMTLRDYFAAKAMQGYVAGKSFSSSMDDETFDLKISQWSYEMADAMLEAREK